MKRLLKIFVLVAAIMPCIGRGALAEPAKINDVYIIHFILDGLNRKAFEKALADGRLPTVKERFIDGGAKFASGMSTFPTTSTTAYQSFVTGLFPGHSGIPHLERFDRQSRKVIGYLSVSGYTKLGSDLINLKALTNPDVAEIEPPTSIFELLKGHQSAAIYSTFLRGASYAFPRKAPIAALWSTYVSGRKERVNVLAMRRVMKLFKRDADEIPRYTQVGLYSTDVLGHSHGPFDPSVQDVLAQFDLFMRNFLDLLKERGLHDKTYIVVSADHGMHESGELFDLQDALLKGGVFVRPKNPRIKGYTLYAANRGVVSSHIYVRHDGGFEPVEDPEILRRHPAIGGGSVDLIDLILKLDATEFLIVRAGERKAKLFSRDGTIADIACYNVSGTDFCSYGFDHKAGDPLGYSSVPSLAKFLDGRPHSSLEWRSAAGGQYYPDGAVLLSQIFQDGRAGDAFITTRSRYGFRKVKEGNHGGADEEDMGIPMLVAGPTVPVGTFGAARSVDMYALSLKWLGLHPPEGNYDGADPFEPAPRVDAAALSLVNIEHEIDGKSMDSEAIRRKIYSMARTVPLPSVAAAAGGELERRDRLHEKLSALFDSLEAQKKGGDAPRIVDKRYLNDHIEIVRRALTWSEEAKRRMEHVVAALSKRGAVR